MKLKDKHRMFADEYIISGNITDAAIKAGYSKSYANAQGYKLLENVGIKKYIDERMAEIKSQKIADQTEVMEFLTAVLRGEASGTALVGEGMGAQSVQQVAPSVAEKVKAAEQIGKRYSMWTDKQEVDVKGAVSFVDDISGDAE